MKAQLACECKGIKKATFFTPFPEQSHKINLPIIDLQHNKPQKTQFTDNDLRYLIDCLCSKGMKLFSHFAHNKSILEEFKNQYLYDNVYLKVVLKKALLKMANQRRIGNNLRGLSKFLLNEIENQAWLVIHLEIKAFYRNKEIQKYEDIFKKGIQQLLTNDQQIL